MKPNASAHWLQPASLMLLRWSSWVVVVAVAVLSLVPGSLRPHVTTADKAEHFAAYLVLAALFALGYHRRVAVTLIGVLLMGYAAALEAGQLFVPGRGVSFADFAWSAAGVWCGIAMAWLVRWLANQIHWPTSEMDRS